MNAIVDRTRTHLLRTYRTDGGEQAHSTFRIVYRSIYPLHTDTRIRTLSLIGEATKKTYTHSRPQPAHYEHG